MKPNLIVLISLLVFFPLKAEVKLPGIFTGNMVLQRDKPVQIWGWADPGEKIQLSFNGQKVTAKTRKDGSWMVQLKSMPANASRANEYASLFPDMISDWREHWNQGDFPFFFVQLSAYGRPSEPTWPELREAQRRALEMPNTGMAVTIDIGNPANIHPENKWDVGKRLALAALKMVYGMDLPASPFRTGNWKWITEGNLYGD